MKQLSLTSEAISADSGGTSRRTSRRRKKKPLSFSSSEQEEDWGKISYHVLNYVSHTLSFDSRCPNASNARSSSSGRGRSLCSSVYFRPSLLIIMIFMMLLVCMSSLYMQSVSCHSIMNSNPSSASLLSLGSAAGARDGITAVGTNSLSSSSMNSKTRSKDKRLTLHAAGFFPVSSKIPEGAIGRGVIPAVELALQHINDSPKILRGIHLDLVWNDTEVSYKLPFSP